MFSRWRSVTALRQNDEKIFVMESRREMLEVRLELSRLLLRKKISSDTIAMTILPVLEANLVEHPERRYRILSDILAALKTAKDEADFIRLMTEKYPKEMENVTAATT